MLFKYKNVRPKKGVRNRLKMFSCLQSIQEIFSRSGHPNLSYISSVFFSGRIMFKCILRTKKALGGSGGMLPRKIFENLLTVGAILALFEQFLSKLCLNFLPLNLSVSPNMMHFVHTVSIMRAHGARLIVIKKV